VNRSIIVLLILSLIGCAEESEIVERLSLDWNYDYSSDVIHATLITNEVSQSNLGTCEVNYPTFKVIESFKGRYSAGDYFNAVGIGAHETQNESSQHLLLLNPFKANEFPGYGDCLNETYSDYLVVHNWCCSIDVSEHSSLIMYDMLNSEMKGENYLYPTKPIFEYLRKRGE
jgi:hypothetical protein